jgi:hypothetical protein
MVGKVVDDPFDSFLDTYSVGVIECAPIDVEVSQREPLDRDFVVIDRQGLVLEERFGLMRGLVGIVRQHALVKALLRRQRRPVAEQHLEELQMLDMPPQHNQAMVSGVDRSSPTGPQSNARKRRRPRPRRRKAPCCGRSPFNRENP